MYFAYGDVERLVGALRRRFAGGTLVFDAVRKSFLNRNRGSSSDGYQPPPWLWAIAPSAARSVPRGCARGLLRLLPLSPIEILRVRL
jgi:hypothetical protein